MRQHAYLIAAVLVGLVLVFGAAFLVLDGMSDDGPLYPEDCVERVLGFEPVETDEAQCVIHRLKDSREPTTQLGYVRFRVTGPREALLDELRARARSHVFEDSPGSSATDFRQRLQEQLKPPDWWFSDEPLPEVMYTGGYLVDDGVILFFFSGNEFFAMTLLSE